MQHHKPNAESVLVTLEHFDVRPEATVVVGDTEFDILMGDHALVCIPSVSVMEMGVVRVLKRQVLNE